MTRLTRSTVDGRVFLDLRARANADGRPVDEYLTLYALEGFLDRLSRSRYRDRFVLKGGVLARRFDERRPTRDVDLAGLQLDNTIESVANAIVEIASIAVDDGLDIATGQVSAESIREESAGYSGLRSPAERRPARPFGPPRPRHAASPSPRSRRSATSVATRGRTAVGPRGHRGTALVGP